MASGTKDFYTSTYIEANLDWSESNINIAENKSTVTVSLWYKRTNSYSGATTDYGNPFYVYIDGSEYNIGSNFAIPGYDNSWHKVGEASKTITHNADGKKSISIGCYHNTSGSLFNCNNSWTVTLDTIPRASIPTATPNPLTIGSSGGTLTINTNRKVNTFTHTVRVECGSWSSGDINNVGDSTTVAVPYTVIAQFATNSQTATATVYCKTYNGSSQIGSEQSCTVTLQVDTATDNVKINSISITDTNQRTHAVTQDDGIMISNISTLRAVVSVGVNGSYTELAGATVICGNTTQTYTLSGTSGSFTFTFDKVNASSLRVNVNSKRGTGVTDIRGWTLIPYQPLTLTGAVGRQSATGSVGYGQIQGLAYGGSFGATTNSLTIDVDFKKHDDADYDPQGTETSTLALTDSGYNQYTKALTFNYTLDYRYQYDIRFTVSDLFSTAEYVCQLMQGLPILSWDENEVDVWGNLHIHDRSSPTVYQDVLQGFNAILAHDGKKNLATTIGRSRVNAGITYTPQNDGSMKVVGTASQESWSERSVVNLDAGDYIISGSAENTAVELYASDATTLVVSSVDGAETAFTVSASAMFYLYVEVPSGKTVDLYTQ